MTKKLIIVGDLNSKYLLSLFLALGHIVYNLVTFYFPEDRQNMVLDLYSTSLGINFVAFIPYILKIAAIDKQNDKMVQKKKWLHYSLLIFCYILFTIMKAIPARMKVSDAQESQKVINPFAEGPFVYIGVEMIFLTIVSIFLLKYKYYNHHYIAMVAFIILGNICDLILDYYPQMIENGPLITFFEFLSILSDVIYYYYIKYMMEVLYYPYWKISLCIGISLFISSTLVLIYVLADKDKANSEIGMISDFYLYFKEVHPGLIIGKQIFIIIMNFINFSLSMLNIYYFSPNFILISYHLSKFAKILIDLIKDKPGKLYCLIFFAIQFFSLMIYLEIIELNFCNLNNNTRRNINLRGLLDVSGENGRDSTVIDINKDYFIEKLENESQKEDNIEMIRQNTTDSKIISSLN